MTIYEQLERAEGILRYAQDVLTNHAAELETWEKKEYAAIAAEQTEKIAHLKDAITYYEQTTSPA